MAADSVHPHDRFVATFLLSEVQRALEERRLAIATIATRKALQLPELVEPILLNLPTRDLLVAQRVCTTWKATIDRSHPIQKALFFMPGTAQDVDTSFLRLARANQNPHEHVAVNELLLPICFGMCRRFASNVEDITRAPGSCHRMFLTQPPVATRAQLHLSLEPTKQRDWVEATAEMTGDLMLSGDETFGHLADRCRAVLEDILEEGYLFIGSALELLLASLVPGEWSSLTVSRQASRLEED
ncbi:hypothetical protein LTR56_026207 [Elasticomyces elasticus]|nr:hypothetical protein LTR56_026207 [Elasticomyces elasticus]KAK3621613.1 hypothetical protein LTR22_025118 [Elasticomyces elasticus]KAK4916475.1 hypothetical protein LTR49_015573 [Elasticomyces elasticus]KAK5755978.1 hypothetical protein LTS12_013867 [Elasticomyces elasticus]